jgi:hypothetical protein
MMTMTTMMLGDKEWMISLGIWGVGGKGRVNGRWMVVGLVFVCVLCAVRGQAAAVALVWLQLS